MNNINIQKAKLKSVKGGYGLDMEFKQTDAHKSIPDLNYSNKDLVHPSLDAAFQALAIHYAILTGYRSTDLVPDISNVDPSLIEGFHVNGFSYGHDDKNPGVTITGTFAVPGTGGSCTSNTPFKHFNVKEETRYVFMDDLQAKLEECDARVMAYYNGKERGTPTQGDLDFPEGGAKVTKMKIDENLGEKVTEEGNNAPDKDKHQFAGKVQMEGVAEMNSNGSDKKSGGKRKVKQTADHPNGEADA